MSVIDLIRWEKTQRNLSNVRVISKSVNLKSFHFRHVCKISFQDELIWRTIWFYHRSFALRLNTWSCKIWRDTRLKDFAPTWRNKIRTWGIIIPVATSTVQCTMMVKRNFGFKIKHRYYHCFTRRKVQIRLDTHRRGNRCRPEQCPSNTMRR